MKRIILGTAGHVDHGKTSLVRYITGVNTDRLKEEISRGITIELGFAPFILPSGQRIGIVDVPGHERFIKNMLAGATGIDIVLFVIAADEGIMPQTREHMDILRLLGVNRGVVVLTKIDTVDAEWLELVLEDIGEYLADTPLCGAQVVEVSSITGAGIPALLDAVEKLCAEVPEKPSSGICRLASDRVFTMSGFGTIVTGTLWSGRIRQGDTLELLPGRKQARVRSLQVHGEKRDEAFAGERVAVNLTGVERVSVERGCWLTKPGALQDSLRIDIRFELLSGAPDVVSRARVHVHHGTMEVLARVILLGKTSLSGGGSCYAQLELESPLSALPGDRVVVRFYSPVFTIGGGTVLDCAAHKYRKKNIDSEILRLDALYSGEPKRILLVSMLRDRLPWQLASIAACLGLDEAEAENLACEIVETGELLKLGDDFYCPTEMMTIITDKLKLWLGDYFVRFPMRFGAPKKEAAQVHFSKMEQKLQRLMFRYLEKADGFSQDETMIWLTGWKPNLTDAQSGTIDKIRGLYEQSPFSPPQWDEAAASIGILNKEQGEYLQWFLRSGEMIRMSDNVIYTQKAMRDAEDLLRVTFPGGFTLAQARDTLKTTRKYAQQIGEYFDLIKTTYWDGERHYWHEN